MPGYEKMESLKNSGSWGKFWWKTCGFEWVKCLYQIKSALFRHHLSQKGESGVFSVYNKKQTVSIKLLSELNYLVICYLAFPIV